jgi:DnaJ-class molecular chaperone
MNRTDCFSILGINPNSDESVIKSAFKKIALQSHPDKVQHLSEEEKQKSEELFKKCSTAYRILLGLEEEEFSPEDIFSQWCDPQTINTMKDIFSSMASNMFSQENNIFTNFYQPNINVPVKIKYSDYFQGKILQKLINFNNSCFETEIDCRRYPKVSRFINFHNIEYELIINMQFEEDDLYEHSIRKDGSVDIIYIIGLTYYHYFVGATHTLKYLDGTDININIKPFSLKDIKYKNKGINGGRLIIRKNIVNPKKENIEGLSKDEYEMYINLTKKIYKNSYQ